MADETKPAAEKPKITLVFSKRHVHVGTDGKEKVYRAGDRDVFTQSDADTIRKLGTAQTLANP